MEGNINDFGDKDYRLQIENANGDTFTYRIASMTNGCFKIGIPSDTWCQCEEWNVKLLEINDSLVLIDEESYTICTKKEIE